MEWGREIVGSVVAVVGPQMGGGGVRGELVINGVVVVGQRMARGGRAKGELMRVAVVEGPSMGEVEVQGNQ